MLEQTPISPYQAYLEQVKQNISKSFRRDGKVCCAHVIQAGEKILLLKRHPLDTFHGGTWCLPGGGVEKGESPFLACVRETYEEAGLAMQDYDPVSTWIVNLPEVQIHYYRSYLKDVSLMSEVYLDNNEHSNYIWALPVQWVQLELILDLKKHLISAMQ